MMALQEAYKEDFATVSSERCRRTDDPQWLVPFWFLTFFQLHNGMARAVPVAKDIMASMGTWIYGDPTSRILSPDHEHEDNGAGEERWYKTQLKVRPKRFCIEDDFSQNNAIYVKQRARLHDFLKEYFAPTTHPVLEAPVDQR